VNSRRRFLKTASSLATTASLYAVSASAAYAGDKPPKRAVSPTHRISLAGIWEFRLDPDKGGEANSWQRPSNPSTGWRQVRVPHTWQIDQDSADYFGTSWYRRKLDIPGGLGGHAVRVEFEAVFHSATVWVNGVQVGQHLRKGYTAFEFDIAPQIRAGVDNLLVVRVNSDFDENMLPRGHSSDWTHDGGIYRPVTLLITPNVYIERVDVDSAPDLATKDGVLDVTVFVRNTSRQELKGQISCEAVDLSTELTVLDSPHLQAVDAPAGKTTAVHLPKLRIANARLWQFDDPNLYSLLVDLDGADSGHQFTTTFGIRSFEVRDGSFCMNGERVRLMGVERMAGSNPNFGMAEPTSWIDHDHDDLKNLNCVFTRVHWPQDKGVLDYCDQHGILIQTEVPTWGSATFKGMQDEPDPAIMQNGLEQLQEMIARDRNHPSIFCWGLCNEINGQNPPAYKFANRMYEESKKLDPSRLRSYASNSLQKNPGNDISKVMDFIEWNEYYESWYPGTPEDLRRNLAEIHQAFPDKPIVISEYGYCACTPDRPEGDARRIEILRDHTRVCRETEYVGGLIFFCYNDYRTHIGDKGTGVMKQRIHGVVDLFGARKPSYEVLRMESSPVETLECRGIPSLFTIRLRTRNSVPEYTLSGYKLRGILYGYGNIPLERQEVELSALKSGETVSVELRFKEQGANRVEFDVLRPTGYSAFTRIWTP
jgi:beta-galactosidase